MSRIHDIVIGYYCLPHMGLLGFGQIFNWILDIQSLDLGVQSLDLGFRVWTWPSRVWTLASKVWTWVSKVSTDLVFWLMLLYIVWTWEARVCTDFVLWLKLNKIWTNTGHMLEKVLDLGVQSLDLVSNQPSSTSTQNWKFMLVSYSNVT